MSAITFEKVSVSIGNRRILTNVSFSIPDGRFVGLLGPNGAGKTTLMRIILGLAQARSGAITVLGHRPSRGNRDIGYVPQFRRGASQLGLSGFDLVLGSVCGNRWGWPFATRAEKQATWEALEQVGARQLALRPVSQLSGGERQRVLIAQALIGNPKLLLLDEPLASLDPAHQRGIVELVSEIARNRGITVLFCAHEINPLLRAVDLVLYLGNGRAAVGTPDDVINRHVLSDLYRTPIHVTRVGGRVFVMAEEAELGGHSHE